MAKERVKKRKCISLETKIQILDKLKSGKGSSFVAKYFDLSEGTVRTIRKSEEKIRACVAAGSPLSKNQISCVRDTTMELMEKALFLWVEDNIQKQIPMDGIAIRHQAVTFFNSIKAKQSSNSRSKIVNFSGSKGWYEKFKKRFSLNKVKIRGKVPSTGEKDDPKPDKIIEEKMYVADEMFFKDKVQNGNPNNKLSQAERTATELEALCSDSSNDCLPKPMFINPSLNGCGAVLMKNNISPSENECYIPTLENEYLDITRLQHQDKEVSDDAASHNFEDSIADEELNAAALVETVIDSHCETNSPERAQKLTLSVLEKGLALGKELETLLVENDSDVDRSLKFQRELNACLAPYLEIHKVLSNDSGETLTEHILKKDPSMHKKNELEKN